MIECDIHYLNPPGDSIGWVQEFKVLPREGEIIVSSQDGKSEFKVLAVKHGHLVSLLVEPCRDTRWHTH